jgi:hypothetical protein
MGKLLCIGLGLLTALTVSGLSRQSHAAQLTDIVFSGALSGKDETVTNLRIFVGRAPTTFACTIYNADGTCNSCTGTSTVSVGTPDPCNPLWVPPSSSVTFSFRTPTGGFPKLVAGTTAAVVATSATASVAAGAAVTMTVSWSILCNAMGAGATCTDETATIKIGVDDSQNDTSFVDEASVTISIVGSATLPTTTCDGSLTNLGICAFTLFPGDEKAYIDPEPQSNNMPTGPETLKMNRVRFYFLEVPTAGTCGTISANYSNLSGDYKEITVNADAPNSSAFLQDDIISGLENEKIYCFRAATLDEANNIGYWTTTPVEVKPSEVIGYFTEEQNCFIATAAYGSRLDPHVQTFRNFRDQVLSKFSLGRKFVTFYYQNAYSWAQVIRKNEMLRTFVRWSLWPIWFIATVTLAVSLPVLISLVIFIIALVSFIRNRQSQSSSRIFWGAGLLLAASLLFQSTNVLAAPRPTTDKPPPEYPYPGASEEESGPTPLKSPKAKKKQTVKKSLDPSEPVLIRITKDGEYIYKRRESIQRRGASLRFGSFDIAAVNPETGLSFSDVYPNAGSILFFDYEWQILRSVGKVAIKLGTGIFGTTGDGRFRSSPATQAKEQYTFIMFPNNLSALWRAQFFDKQIIVPFAEGGAGYYTFAEVRDDFKRTKLGGVSIAQWAVGASLLLDFLDPSAMIELDEDHGVNHLWLTAEFRSITSLKEDFDISNDVISAGFFFEF